MKKAIALPEMLVTMSIIAVITAIGLFGFRYILFGLSLNNEAELLQHYMNNAQSTADINGRNVTWEHDGHVYKIIDLEKGLVLKERRVPEHVLIQGPSVTFSEQLRPDKGATVLLVSKNKSRKITVDPSTGRIKLW